MKVMHAYYAKESPIPPPLIMPPSPMLSPMLNPKEFFLPEELLPPKKRRHDRSSSSTPTLPQEFEIGESFHKTSLERHKEQIEEILNHLDELSLDRIENMEDNIEGLRKGRVIIQQDFDNLETELQEIRAQVAKLQRKQLGQNNKIALACFRIHDLEQIIKEIQARHQAYKESLMSSKGVVGLIRWFERTESMFSHNNCIEDCKVKFDTATLTEEALSWWNSIAQTIGIEEAYKLSWVRFRKILIKNIEGNVTASKPQTLEEAINIAQRLVDQVGHMTRNYRNKGPAIGSNLLPMTVTCHVCEEKGHYANQFRKTTNNNAQGRAYMLKDRNAHQDPNIVMGMFLLNQHLARVLFDSGTDKSFISISLASMLNILPTTIDTFYNIKMADGNLVSTNTVIQGCTLTLLNQPFKIDLTPIKLSSFNVVVGMDCLSKYHAKIIWDEKVVHIPINSETLIIRGDRRSPSQPFNLLETCGFLFLLVPGSSGGGGKSLPSGFLVWGRLVTGFEAWWEKRLHSATVFQTLGTG
nr:reverse transcriptase domain-containing protein [Tanacetum cinerariifolium]